MKMRDQPRRELIKLVKNYGADLYASVDYCQNLLQKRCGEYQREIFVLKTAVEQEIPKNLLFYQPTDKLIFKLIADLKQQLVNNCALLPSAAEWAVVSWGRALGVVSETDLDFENQAVNFSCNNFELVIRNKLKKYIDPLTVEDVQQITQLTVTNRTLTSLQGLEYLINLEELNLCLTHLHELSVIGSLSNLVELNLRGNQITDIGILSNLTQLRALYLQGNRISQLTALAELKKLKVLDLRGNKVKNLAPLSDLVNLTELYLDSNQITDLTPLASLTNLRYLFATGNPLEEKKQLNESVINKLEAAGVYLQY